MVCVLQHTTHQFRVIPSVHHSCSHGHIDPFNFPQILCKRSLAYVIHNSVHTHDFVVPYCLHTQDCMDSQTQLHFFIHNMDAEFIPQCHPGHLSCRATMFSTKGRTISSWTFPTDKPGQTRGPMLCLKTLGEIRYARKLLARRVNMNLAS